MRKRGQLSRREAVRAGLIAGAGLLARPALSSAADATAVGKPFRVAHLTDMHVQPELRAIEGYSAALASLDKLDPRPDLLITGGDHVMDCTDQFLPRSKVVWNAFQQAAATSKLPVRPILGNHDVFGWEEPKVDEATVGYGKAMALDELKLARSYYSFDAGGWKFILLDSMTRRGNEYLGDLGPEQTEWLKGELQSAPETTPIIIFSHIPVLAACVFFDVENPIQQKETNWKVPDAWMHRDLHGLLDLFQPPARNVRLLMSGHIHLVDRVDYRGMTFICDGAVSGNWWKGQLQQFPEGYGVIDLWPDGRFEHRYVTYGWKAEKE